ncbi:hypothetical protein STCU_12053 [Strigomonas culicis]|uniref:Proteophosphoglycan ppg4 n=1 Tax=Strigomonas culicis TaxID=28005 RepID=S9UL35_9TRYP|nr:hypothetical protein STCU_12053 [Strigomonas culicis]|eukprot:EPY15401.1 hypothetical protein STCU_12053 [Strigomonas culicis]
MMCIKIDLFVSLSFLTLLQKEKDIYTIKTTANTSLTDTKEKRKRSVEALFNKYSFLVSMSKSNTSRSSTVHADTPSTAGNEQSVQEDATAAKMEYPNFPFLFEGDLFQNIHASTDNDPSKPFAADDAVDGVEAFEFPFLFEGDAGAGTTTTAPTAPREVGKDEDVGFSFLDFTSDTNPLVTNDLIIPTESSAKNGSAVAANGTSPVRHPATPSPSSEPPGVPAEAAPTVTLRKAEEAASQEPPAAPPHAHPSAQTLTSVTAHCNEEEEEAAEGSAAARGGYRVTSMPPPSAPPRVRRRARGPSGRRHRPRGHPTLPQHPPARELPSAAKHTGSMPRRMERQAR